MLHFRLWIFASLVELHLDRPLPWTQKPWKCKDGTLHHNAALNLELHAFRKTHQQTVIGPLTEWLGSVGEGGLTLYCAENPFCPGKGPSCHSLPTQSVRVHTRFMFDLKQFNNIVIKCIFHICPVKCLNHNEYCFLILLCAAELMFPPWIETLCSVVNGLLR